MSFWKRIHLPALGGLATTIVGLAKLAADPSLLSFMSHDVAVAVTSVGAAILAVTKAIHTKGQPNN